MKVLLINGSPRKEGNTFVALTEFAQQLEKNGIQREWVWSCTKPVRGGIACNSCHDNRCVFNDDITNSIIAKMEECDGLVIGSPVYYGQLLM